MEKAKLFKELGNAAKLRIIEELTKGERCVCEITPITGLAQPTTSLHLKALEKAGLIKKRREGTKIYYSLTNNRIKELLKAAEEIT